ncbi:hypothetical protein PAP_04570 [Palaeococcus pacificus DY20341]|uniref:Uncharacterized protein n=1 Tax=Palaeococcus pacificus DY20341 TaxID=1343739 RepID=A0A075LRG2_9EURY|nr:A24 family peptidase C-terminal domain-containing protein [Palaeococcus pacificus]AIF69325.1 hypothetical protein PAP_04570 [Palaeococcus pacificus DY20341]
MEVVLIILGVILGVLTSYTDIKTGFIDDKHVFPIAALGVLYYLYQGFFVEHNTLLALSGLIGLGIGFLLGYLLYFIGGWASGDVVILMGFSALFPYASSYAKIKAPYAILYPLHPITLLFNSIIAIFPVIFLYALGVLIARKRTERLKTVFLEKADLSIEASLWIIASLIAIIVVQAKLGITLNPAVRYLITIALITILSRFKKAGDVLGILALAYGLYSIGLDMIYAYLKLLVALYVFKIFFSIVKVLREEVLVEEKPIEEIKEWDIIGEWIYEKDGEVLRDRESFFDKFKKAFASGDLSILKPSYGNVITSPTAEGIRREQLEKLKALVEEGKLENSFLVKKAMPFAPALFLGFLISIFYGDIFWWLVLKMAGL